MSGAPIIKGTNQFPNPPIMTGITKKKIIINAWAVTITLYNWESKFKTLNELNASSERIATEKKVPITPAKLPKIRYSVPISLWFVEYNHL